MAMSSAGAYPSNLMRDYGSYFAGVAFHCYEVCSPVRKIQYGLNTLEGKCYRSGNIPQCVSQQGNL